MNVVVCRDNSNVVINNTSSGRYKSAPKPDNHKPLSFRTTKEVEDTFGSDVKSEKTMGGVKIREMGGAARLICSAYFLIFHYDK